jgi:signal transduction histidine kinase
MAANRDGVWNVQGESIRITVVPAFWRTWWFLTLVVISIIGIMFLLYRLRIHGLHQAKLAQEEFSRSLIESQEAERKRIAAELHDSLAQDLLVIKNRAMLTISTLGDREKTVNQLNEISAAADQAIDEVAEISYNLRPYQLDRLGLTKAIESMLRKISASSGIRFKFDIARIDALFTPEAEINLYRIIQECANNIVKHSEATEADVTIKKEATALKISISDNGKGFRRDSNSSGFMRESGGYTNIRTSGFGLVGISERVRILGGKHIIQSSQNGGGTTVTILIEGEKGRRGEGEKGRF